MGSWVSLTLIRPGSGVGDKTPGEDPEDNAQLHNRWGHALSQAGNMGAEDGMLGTYPLPF